jgi:hypothetical protein
VLAAQLAESLVLRTSPAQIEANGRVLEHAAIEKSWRGPSGAYAAANHVCRYVQSGSGERSDGGVLEGRETP